MTGQELMQKALEELYTAIQALENGNLPFARSSSTRATGLIVEAHQAARKIVQQSTV